MATDNEWYTMNLRAQLFDRITFHKPREPDVLTVDDADTMHQLVARSWQSFEEKQKGDKKVWTAAERDEDELKRYGSVMRDFEMLKGLTLIRIERTEHDEEIFFHAIDTQGAGTLRRFKMWYEQDCCASCSVEDITGDFADLIGTPLLMAEEVTSHDAPAPRPEDEYRADSETWTFYKLATIKGSVTIRWYGASNGYYSEEASFAELRVNGVS